MCSVRVYIPFPSVSRVNKTAKILALPRATRATLPRSCLGRASCPALVPSPPPLVPWQGDTSAYDLPSEANTCSSVVSTESHPFGGQKSAHFQGVCAYHPFGGYRAAGPPPKLPLQPKIDQASSG